MAFDKEYLSVNINSTELSSLIYHVMTEASLRVTLLGKDLKEKAKEKRGKGRVKHSENWNSEIL